VLLGARGEDSDGGSMAKGSGGHAQEDEGLRAKSRGRRKKTRV